MMLAWTTRLNVPVTLPDKLVTSFATEGLTRSFELAVRVSPVPRIGEEMDPVPPSLTGELKLAPPSMLYRSNIRAGTVRSSSRSIAKADRRTRRSLDGRDLRFLAVERSQDRRVFGAGIMAMVLNGITGRDRPGGGLRSDGNVVKGQFLAGREWLITLSALSAKLRKYDRSLTAAGSRPWDAHTASP
jgi:hypothetical protein